MVKVLKIEGHRRTHNNINIESRISDGITKFFTIIEFNKAVDLKNRKRSYVYRCYDSKKLVGWCVPN